MGAGVVISPINPCRGINEAALRGSATSAAKSVIKYTQIAWESRTANKVSVLLGR
jgi:hypothetical protein